MGDLSDRILFSVMAASAAAGLVGYWLTIVVAEVPDWFTRFALPGLVVVFLLAVLAAFWIEFSLLD